MGTNGLGRVVGGSPDSLGLINAPGQDILQALPHIGCGAGDGIGAGQLCHTAPQFCDLAAQVKLIALGLAGAAARVGNQDHPVFEHGESQADSGRMDVETITDDLGLHIGILHTGRDNTGGTVGDTGHSVVQVGQMGDTGIDGSLGIVIGAVGVGDGYGAKILGLCHEFGSAGQLGSDVHDGDQAAAAVIQLLEAIKIRLLQIVGVLGTTLLVGEVGAFHLDTTQNAEAFDVFVHQLSGVGEGLFQHIVGQGHGSGGEGGDTAFGVVAGHGLQTLVIAVGEVGAGVAVAVDFDQTGDHGGTLQVNGIGGNSFGQNFAENAVLYFKSAGVEGEIGGENAGIFIEHNPVSFIYNIVDI